MENWRANFNGYNCCKQCHSEGYLPGSAETQSKALRALENALRTVGPRHANTDRKSLNKTLEQFFSAWLDLPRDYRKNLSYYGALRRRDGAHRRLARVPRRHPRRRALWSSGG